MPPFTKATQSLSPLSLQNIPARIVQQGQTVFLEKTDEQGRVHSGLVEKNADIYELLTTGAISAQVEPTVIHVYFSSACNLKCNLCYEPREDHAVPTIDQLTALSRRFPGCCFVLMGREPTCRPELVEALRMLTPRHRVSILTNGIRLADREYVRKLRESGLTDVIFSLNGLTDDIFRRMNGRPLLDIKLRALRNIREAGFYTKISMTLARGVNTGQIRPVCQFCFENRAFVSELRIRTMSPVGIHMEGGFYCISEMLDLVAGSLGIEPQDVLKEHVFKLKVLNSLNRIIPKRFQAYARMPNCTLSFHVRRKKGYSACGACIDFKRIQRARFKAPLYLFYLLKMYGVRYLLEKLCAIHRLPLRARDPEILMIVLKSWPNIMNIDLAENRKCPSLYYKDGRLNPFCLAVIKAGGPCHEAGTTS